MRRKLLALVLIVLFLAVFIPFASTYPDGLERVAETLGIETGSPIWSGLMPDYSWGALGKSYVSTFAAGAFGTMIVLFACFALGKVLSRKGKFVPEKEA